MNGSEAPLKIIENCAGKLRFAAVLYLLPRSASLRGARHLLRPSGKLASFVTIVALRDV
jgi:hypothetical protein